MSPAEETEVDPSVCYRHPDRTSWTLCERCGRTICPECQILTPQGVRCPDCVRETGGSVQWTPVSSAARTSAAQAKRRRATRAQITNDRPRWQEALLGMLRPGDSTPVVSWTIAALSIAVWVAGIFTNVATNYLAVAPATTWQIWRFVTYPLVSLAGYSAISVIFFFLSIFFFLITAPGAEREFGRRRFLIVVLASGVAGGAIGSLAFGFAFGLSAVLFGIFGSFLVLAWPSPVLRTRLLISIAAYALFTLLFSSVLIGQVIGGLIGGTGAFFLLHRAEDSRAGLRRASITIWLVLAGLVILAVVKNVILLLST